MRTTLRGKSLTERWGTFHCIYSMGLFDYLTPPVARVVTRRLYDLLEPGGEVSIGNYHVGNPTRYYMEYWLDWVLYYRTEEEMMQLAADLEGVDADLFRDDSGVQMFLRLRKR